MKGCQRLQSSPVKRKRALTFDDLHKVVNELATSNLHDDLLFIAMLLTSFFTLMHLGKLTFPDEIHLRNWKKIMRRSTVVVTNEQYKFLLPAHKADRFFDRNRIIVKKDQYCNINPLAAFQAYLTSRDDCFPLSSPLWILHNGTVPTRQFFITRLCHFFD